MKPHEEQLLEILRKAKPYDQVEVNIDKQGHWAVIHKTQAKVIIRTTRLEIRPMI